MSLGLCLSGGGIKGVAHIGVLQALEDHNIHIDYISGTSSGSIVATLYAIGYSPNEIYEFFKKYSKKMAVVNIRSIMKFIYGLVFKRKIIIQGLNNGKKFEKVIYNICKEKNVFTIDQIKFPLVITSVNIETGETYLFTSQDVRSRFKDSYIYDNKIPVYKAIRSSCNFPGLYCPSSYNDIQLMDGGIRENIPWRETKMMGADKVLSVIFEKDTKQDSFLDIFEIIRRSINLLSHELSLYEQYGCDYILKINTKNTTLLDTSKIEFLYDVRLY